MNLPFYIARRYVFSKKTHNVINIISGISVFGISISTMAMVMVLSGFNGIEYLIEDMYSAFDSDIQITPKKGKKMGRDAMLTEDMMKIEGVEHISAFIEETTLLKNDNGDGAVIARMKGVEPQFLEMNDMDRFIIEGEGFIENFGRPFTIMGSNLMVRLDAYIHSTGGDGMIPYEMVEVIGLRGDRKLSKAREDAVIDTTIEVSGRFAINPKYDENYFIVPLDFAGAVLGYDDKISGIEIGLSEDADLDDVKEELAVLAGSDYNIKDKFDQNQLLFKTHKSEKWMTFLILCFIFVLSTFNMIASLTMLVLDKQQDIGTLKSMGAGLRMVRSIFFIEGLLINLLGAFLGLALGLAMVLGQKAFGWVTMGEGAIVEAFPVRIVWFDLIWIFALVLIVGVMSSYLPVRYLLRKSKFN